MKRRLFVLCLGCLGACHLAAQAAERISAADPRHFMQPVEPGHFAEEIQALESSGAVALLQSGYAITRRSYYLAPSAEWNSFVTQGDSAAAAWKGERQKLPGRRVGQDWVELWADAKRLRAEALVMSQQPVDSSGNCLIGYYTLAALAREPH